MDIKRRFNIFSVLLIVILPVLIRVNTKNTCPSYLDYFLINFSGECYYNPDVELGVPNLIAKYTGNLRQYSITTKDGYILTMFRIFRERPKGVLLLQPPISAGAIAWMSDGNNSIAFELWNMGYDVWLSNHRGASYSRKHINLTEADPEFWNYSFHEIAMYDFEAQFDLIRNETGSQVTYVSYSMSATSGLIYAAMKPEEAKENVKTFILIAPTTVMSHFTSPFKILLYLMAPFKQFFELGEFFTVEVVRWIANFVTVVPLIVDIFASIVMGWTPTEMDPILYPYIFAHHGRGITNKMLYHYEQIISSDGNFSMYDYGKARNLDIYGQETVPDYPLHKILTPLYIMYGEKDILAASADIETLCDKLLPKDQLRGKIMIPNNNHIDYLFSKHRRKKTYQSIFDVLEEVYKTSKSK